MVTAAALTTGGVFVRFADHREGVIPLADLDLEGRPERITVPDPYVIEVHLVGGTVAEVPWDFARCFVDPGYRGRSEAAAARDRRRFGEQLRELRAARGLKQEALAERTGLNRVTIARFETGERLPRYRTLVALAKGLEVQPERLLAP